MQEWLACQTPLQLLAVVMTQMAECGRQHAPRRGTQLLGVQGMPLPSQTRLCAWHWASLVMMQKPVSGLQHPPRGQGLGMQGALAIQIPLVGHWVKGVMTQTPSGVQHAPPFGQGLGVQVVLGKKGPGQLAKEV